MTITYDADTQSLQLEAGSLNLTLDGVEPVFIAESNEGIRHYVPLSDDEIALLQRTVEYMIPRARDPENRVRFEAIRAQLEKALPS